MKKNLLSMAIIFEASSLNYGESTGNIQELKKISRNGETYTYISKQAIKHNLRTEMGFPLAKVTPPKPTKDEESKTSDKTKSVIQFDADSTIKDFAELDLFGYMKTNKGGAADTRTGAVKISNAYSLEPYMYDMDFGTNAGITSRIGEFPSLVNTEIHKSFYGYTVNIDLDRIGVLEPKNNDTSVSQVEVIKNDEKIERLLALINTIEFLYRDIKGERKSLAPLFVIGGLYDEKNAIFENALKMDNDGICLSIIEDILEYPKIKADSRIGVRRGIFKNEAELFEKFEATSICKFFEELRAKIKDNFTD